MPKLALLDPTKTGRQAENLENEPCPRRRTGGSNSTFRGGLPREVAEHKGACPASAIVASKRSMMPTCWFVAYIVNRDLLIAKSRSSRGMRLDYRAPII